MPTQFIKDFIQKESSGGVSVLTGIGFTMSLFVDSLAYNDTQIYNDVDETRYFS